MPESEQFELVGRKRAQYRENKKQLEALRARATEWSDFAETIYNGLRRPELIRWFEGVPAMGRRAEQKRNLACPSLIFEASGAA
jgi:hypothetical protein